MSADSYMFALKIYTPNSVTFSLRLRSTFHVSKAHFQCHYTVFQLLGLCIIDADHAGLC